MTFSFDKMMIVYHIHAPALDKKPIKIHELNTYKSHEAVFH